MLYLSDEKTTKYVIVIRKYHTPSEQTAAEELAKYLNLISGAQFPIVTDDADPCDREIVIGYCTRPGCSADLSLGDEGYTVRTEGKRLLILGSEVRGALYGVYAFLEKYCGCRFYTEHCERIPTVGDLMIPSDIDLTEVPVLEYRNVYWHSTFGEMISARLKINGGMGRELTDKVGGGIYYIGAYCHTFPELAETFNQWDMPCLCDENVYQTTLKNVKKAFRENPDKHIITVSQVDGNNGECSCEKCRAVYEEEQSHMGTLLRFVNRIQEDVKDEFPDAVIDTLAYQYTRTPPKVTKPHPDLILRLCNVESCLRHPIGRCDCVDGRGKWQDHTYEEDVKGWSAVASKLYVWEYTTNFTNMSTAFPNLIAIRENIRFYVENGVTGIFAQGNSSCPNGEFGELRAYLIAKLLWDPFMTDSELRLHMMEFCSDFYGAGGKFVAEYVELMHSASEDAHMRMYFDDSSKVIRLKGYGSELEGAFAFYRKGSELFDKAEAATWTKGNRAAYDNVRRSRIQLYNYNNFILKAKKSVCSTPEEEATLELAIMDNNRRQLTLMREFGVTEAREFARIDFSKVPDLHSYALWW